MTEEDYIELEMSTEHYKKLICWHKRNNVIDMVPHGVKSKLSLFRNRDFNGSDDQVWELPFKELTIRVLITLPDFLKFEYINVAECIEQSIGDVVRAGLERGVFDPAPEQETERHQLASIFTKLSTPGKPCHWGQDYA